MAQVGIRRNKNSSIWKFDLLGFIVGNEIYSTVCNKLGSVNLPLRQITLVTSTEHQFSQIKILLLGNSVKPNFA